MTVAEAEKKLKEMMHEAGIDWAAPDALACWKVFKVFCCLSFECGAFDFGYEPKMFYFSMKRHFWLQFDEDDEDNDPRETYTERITCRVAFELQSELEKYHYVFGNFDLDASRLGEFFSAEETQEAFQIPVTKFQAKKLEISRSD
jgi:hypothetical protein